MITALEIAATRRLGRPVVPEVSIFFDSLLLRGNRTKKVASSYFSAFESKNYPPLAQAGIKIDYDEQAIAPYRPVSRLKVSKKMNPRVAILKLFPGITADMIEHFINIPKLQGIVMETYGSGNAPTDDWFISILRNAIDKGIAIFNVSQCDGGKVIQGRYETSKTLADIGVSSGSDITTEAAITKMMYLLGKEGDNFKKLNESLITPLSGEMSYPQ